jgi:hypothetical protein
MINSAGLKTHPVITSSLERCKLLSPLQTTENPAHQRALQDWQIVKSWTVKMASKSSLVIQLSNKIKHRAPQCCMKPRPMDQSHAKNFFKTLYYTLKHGMLCRIWQAAHYSLGLVTKIHRFRHTNTLDFLLHFCNLHFQEHLPWLPHWGSKYPGFLHHNTVHFESHELLRKENLHHSRV